MSAPWILPITRGDLVEIARSFTAQFPSVRPSPEAMQYAMAARLLRAYVGDEWTDSNIGPRAADPYLTPRSADAAERMKVQARVAALGELIFNLQFVSGGRERIARIGRSSLEVAVSDLEAARLLSLSEREFRFVSESGVRGADYDIEIIPEPGITLCCESKCKLEATALSEETILNSLRDAADQLPPGSPGVVFVKVPESWARSAEIAEAAPSALRRFFGMSGRTREVVFHWEEWERAPTGGVVRLAKYREEMNVRSRFFDDRLPPLLRPWSPIWNPPTWTRLTDAIDLASRAAESEENIR